MTSVKWDIKGLVNFNARKVQLLSFDWFNNTGGAIDMKIDGSVLKEK